VQLLHGAVLGGGVKIAQSPLEGRGLIERAATAEREARIDCADAGGGEPHGGLRALREEGLALQRSGERVAPMAPGLDIQKRARGSDFGRDTAELGLECFRLAHRYRGALLLPPGPGQRDELVEGTRGDTDGDGTVEQWKEVPRGLIERPGQAGHTAREIEEIRRRDDRVPLTAM
jgi:hypothetical protein